MRKRCASAARPNPSPIRTGAREIPTTRGLNQRPAVRPQAGLIAEGNSWSGGDQDSAHEPPGFRLQSERRKSGFYLGGLSVQSVAVLFGHGFRRYPRCPGLMTRATGSRFSGDFTRVRHAPGGRAIAHEARIPGTARFQRATGLPEIQMHARCVRSQATLPMDQPRIFTGGIV